jgi:NAD(P)-dependent dehydrogenase (short-subunit alcohol dehydrogenase family)
MVAATAIGPDAVFLVSGGARGITAQCVIGMARRFACGFILLGRTQAVPLPAWFSPELDDGALKQRIAHEMAARGERATPPLIQREFRAIRAGREIAATLEAVQASGSRVLYVSADVADAVSLRAALAPAVAQMGAVSGILHGAGALADKRIEQKSGADFDAVFEPKISGLRNLLAVVPMGQLRHLLLFSSAAGFFGNLGQSDYAMANEILNKAAYQLQRRHPQCRVLAFDWGPWDGGMVTPAIKELFARRRIEVIPIDGGVQVLLDLLEAPAGALQVVVGSPMRPAPAPLDGTLRSFSIGRRLRAADNPFLQDHIVGEHAVLPATAAAAWMIEACRQQHPGYQLLRCEQFQVLKGIVFDAQVAEAYQLDLKETAQDPAAGRVRLEALISSQTAAGQPRYHYRAQIELGAAGPPAPLRERVDLAECDAVEGALFYGDGTLFHGPGLQSVVRLLRADGQGLRLHCRLAALTAQQHGQFPVRDFNPFVADSLLQAGLIWVRRQMGAASLPLGWAAAESYLSLHFDTDYFLTLEVREAGEPRLLADIVAQDAQGRVALWLRGAEFAVSRQLNRLFGAVAPGAVS